MAGFAFLIAHEMDAVRLHEWRMLPVLSRLADHTAYLVFCGLHVPIFLVLFILVMDPADVGTAQITVAALDVFFIIHVGLHLIYLRHPKNEFTSVFSWALITGAGLAGAADLTRAALT